MHATARPSPVPFQSSPSFPSTSPIPINPFLRAPPPPPPLTCYFPSAPLLTGIPPCVPRSAARLSLYIPVPSYRPTSRVWLCLNSQSRLIWISLRSQSLTSLFTHTTSSPLPSAFGRPTIDHNLHFTSSLPPSLLGVRATCDPCSDPSCWFQPVAPGLVWHVISLISTHPRSHSST